MIGRTLTQQLRRLFTQYPVVIITGPRQSGKTTLCRATFPDLHDVNLERPDHREFATNEVDLFLAIEIKAGETISRQFFAGLNTLRKLLAEQLRGEMLVYGGAAQEVRHQVRVTFPRAFVDVLAEMEADAV